MGVEKKLKKNKKPFSAPAFFEAMQNKKKQKQTDLHMVIV